MLFMNDIIKLRHKLHTLAELSGEEKNTSLFISDYLKDLRTDKLFSICKYGIAAIFTGKAPGKTTLFRADIDALPIAEDNKLSYKSSNPNVSHRCGHDGHTAIMLGFANYCAQIRPDHGNVILLFQPAEETGQGALSVISDELFHSIKPDYAFGMHNLPGLPTNAIIVRKGVFACASKGITILLKGIPSHASEPEKGHSPANVLSYLISELPPLANPDIKSDDFSLLTVTHANLGTPGFGISPSKAVLMLTIRSISNAVLSQLDNNIRALVNERASRAGIQFFIEYQDEFPATINDIETVNIFSEILTNYNIIQADNPFKWSEDFAHFTELSKGVLFGIGAGISHPPLHSTDYDFNDDIVPTGISVWKTIYHKFHMKEMCQF